MSAARRRLGTGPAPTTPAPPPAAPRRLPAERAFTDKHRDDDREQTQPGRDRRPLGTGAPTTHDAMPLFFYGGEQPDGTH